MVSTIGTTNTPSFVKIQEVTLQNLGDLTWNDPNINDTLMHFPEASTTWLWVARSAFTDGFCQPCKTVLVYYRACEATGEHLSEMVG